MAGMRKAKNDSFREFSQECDARKFVLESLQHDFDFFEEVWVRNLTTQQRLRIDAVSVCQSSGHVIGWEFKKSHLFKGEFAQAIKQAADYRDSIIDDPNMMGLNGQRVEACLVFPDWTGLHDNGEILYQREADGMRLVAMHFRVGTFCHDGALNKQHIIVGEQAIWHSNSGWTGNADGVLLGKRRHGSQKRFD